MSEALLIERVDLRAPFGVRFRDDATGRAVRDGLDVTIQRRPKSIKASRNPSGVFFAQGLPGLRRYELDDTLPLPVTVPRIGRVRVRDRAGRFHPFALDPGDPFSGLAYPQCGPPASPPAERDRFIPLFSAPARIAPTGMATVRARLVDPSGAGAAWAALIVTPPGALSVRGIADHRGEVVVFFLYPEPNLGIGASPGGAAGSLSDETWTVGISVTVPSLLSPPEAEDQLPDLCRFLDHVPAALRTSASPTAPVTQATLEYGRELVLASPGPDPELVVI